MPWWVNSASVKWHQIPLSQQEKDALRCWGYVGGYINHVYGDYHGTIIRSLYRTLVYTCSIMNQSDTHGILQGFCTLLTTKISKHMKPQASPQRRYYSFMILRAHHVQCAKHQGLWVGTTQILLWSLLLLSLLKEIVIDIHAYNI